jgi:erythromycin esterase-like protein/membrane protease YdiL (CAAX protease family)
MKDNFLENATLGTNKWWQYVLSILSAVAGIAVVNMFISQVLPSFKLLFPDNDFGKTFFTFSLVLLVFGVAVIAFLVIASKLHKRSKMSFISNQDKFNWKSYFIGFVAWGILLFIGLLISDYQKFEVFRANFNAAHFLTLFLLGFIAIGIQSFFEEVLVRGYFLQGLHLRIKNIAMLIIINGVIFGLLHFGYGLESFLFSWLFGIAFTIIVILQNRIEFVAGAHNANNLLLSLVFLDLSEATNEKFSWAINWVDFSLHIVALLLLVGLVFMFFKRKHIGWSKKSLFLLGSILLLSQQSFSQSNSISNEWIKNNVHTINNDSLSAGKFDFLKEKISDKRIVFLGEATHYDGATFAARSEMVDFLIKEMGFEVILFEAGMFDLMQANKEFQETGQSQKIKSSLWDFWRTQQWEHFYSSIEKHKQNGKPIQMAGFDCKFSSSYGFGNHNYSTFIEGIFKDKYSEATNTDEYKAYISIWKDIEKGYQQNGMKGGLAKIRYKMSDKDKIKFRQLSLWVVSKLNSIGEHKIAQMVKSNDESIIAYSDIRLLKLIFNKKSIIPINNRRDELMAENIIHLLKNVYPDKKVIVIGATYHFIRNNNFLEPIKIQGISIQESVIMGNLIYNSFPNEIYTIGFTAFEGNYGIVDKNKKGIPVKSPSENSLEFQLASRRIENAFVTLENSGNELFFSQGTVLRLFDHQSAASSKQWDKILDAVFFIKTMKPAEK